MYQIFRTSALVAALSATTAFGQSADPFAQGWTLDQAQSILRFQTIKNVSKVELHKFHSFRGAISEDGSAEVVIDLDSVETNVDMRNVRLRFILFETFENPEAKISLQIPRAAIADLEQVRRKRLTLPYTMEFVGLRKTFETEVVVTLIDDNTVSVASAKPISYTIPEFGLEERLQRLEETVDVDVIPSATFTFNFAFNRNGTGTGQAPERLNLASLDAPAGTRPALATGRLSLQDCVNQFKAISISGRITFASGSAALQPFSYPFIDAIAKTIRSCPEMALEVSGHTDSQGDPNMNQRLSLARAQAVTDELIRRGVKRSALGVIGMGDTRPVADNSTARGRERNRRIEFAVTAGS